MKNVFRFVAALLCFVLLLCSCTPAEPDTAADPRQTPEALAFYNAEKEPWGVHDFSLYSYEGEVLETVQAGDESGIGLYPLDEKVTYRGIGVGDDLYAELIHMQLPPQAIFETSSPDVAGETCEPFSLETVAAQPNATYLIIIYFDADFNVLDVQEVFPFVERVGAQWNIVFIVQGGVITNYYASYMHFISYGEGDL